MAALRFVGREAELRTIAAALDGARDGSGGLILLSGEAGIGKTRLAEAVSEYAHKRGLTVGWGRAWESAGAPAYWPWIQLGRLLAPQLASLLYGASSSEERFALFEEAVSMLLRAPGERGALAVLDDMHAADIPSLELLRFLAESLPSAPLLVLATHRDPERVEPLVAEGLAELARVGTRLPLSGISESDVAELVKETTGSVEPASVQRIHAATEGNPLFVTELVSQLTDGAAGADARLPVPAGVREALRRRLARLSPGAISLLESAAVIGRDFSAAVLADAADSRPEDVLAGLDEGASVGLVQRDPRAAGSYRWAHALVFETLLDDLSPARRAKLHLAVGEALELGYGPKAEEHAAELAHHLRAALPLGETARARKYLVLAGDRALRQLAFEESARFYSEALQLLGVDGSGGTRARCDLLAKLGESLARLGNFVGAREAFSDALDLATQLSDADRVARSALGYAGPKLAGAVPSRRFGAPLRRALDAGPAVELRVAVLARLAVEFDLRSPIAERRRPSDEALRLAREAADPDLIAQAIRAQVATTWSHHSLEDILHLADELLSLEAEPRFALDAHAWRQVVLMQLGDRAAAEAAAAEHERLAHDLRDPVHRMLAILTRGGLALMDGRLDESEEAVRELRPFVARDRALRSLALSAISTLMLPLIIWGRGDPREMVAMQTKLAGRFPQVISFGAVAGVAHARCGDRESARMWYERTVDEQLERPVDERWDGTMVPLAWLCFELQDAARAPRIYSALAPMSGRFALVPIWSAIANTLGAWDTYRGLVAHTMGQHSLAREHFEAGLALDRRLGARLWMAQAMFWEVQAMRRVGDPDETRANRLLDQSRALAEELGLEHLLADIGAGARADHAVFLRDESGWLVGWGSSRTRFADARGMTIIARLIEHPGDEFHVLELTGEEETVAKARRVRTDLSEELDESAAHLDGERAAAASEALELTARELVDGSAVERARINVTRAIARALKRIRAEQPELAAHLDRSLRRGVICAYEPRVGDEVEWEQAHEGAPAGGRRPLRPRGPVAR